MEDSPEYIDMNTSVNSLKHKHWKILMLWSQLKLLGKEMEHFDVVMKIPRQITQVKLQLYNSYKQYRFHTIPATNTPLSTCPPPPTSCNKVHKGRPCEECNRNTKEVSFAIFVNGPSLARGHNQRI